MGCQASKGAAGAHNKQLGPLCSDLPPPLKLSHPEVAHVDGAGKKSRAQAYVSHTPAITPQAETAPPSAETCSPTATMDRDHQRSSGEIREQSKSGGRRKAAGGAEQTEGSQPAAEEEQQKDKEQQHYHHHQQLEHAQEEANDDADWPESPPVLLVLHLFLENHRPRRSRGGDPSPSRRVRFPGGLAYEGQLRHQEDGGGGGGEVPHGWGRLTFPDSAFYEGAWRGGVVHGKGALHLPNGNSYFGSWANGRKHGLGTYVYEDGSCHEGFYADGERNGVGTMRYATGAVFEGEFRAGLRHGVGRLELAGGGASYDGDWADDVPHGHGIHVDPADGGERFEGSWRHGIRHGGGTLVQGWAEKQQQEEEEEDVDGVDAMEEEEEGEGMDGVASEMAWYSGKFRDGYPHGTGLGAYGQLTFCGHLERGVWSGGGRIDLGEDTFEGTWLDGIPRGNGRWQCKQSGVEKDCTFEEGYSHAI